jgi:outer membrane protein assembly factor BamB
MYREPPAPAPLLIVAFSKVVVGIERRTGRRVWEWWDRSIIGDWSRIALFGRYVVVASSDVASDPHVVCLAYETGACLWRTASPLGPETFLLDGGELFVASGGKVACIDFATGALLWHDPFNGYGIDRVAMAVPGYAAQPTTTGGT